MAKNSVLAADFVGTNEAALQQTFYGTLANFEDFLGFGGSINPARFDFFSHASHLSKGVKRCQVVHGSIGGIDPLPRPTAPKYVSVPYMLI